MLSTKSTYKCPNCKNEINVSPKIVKDTPVCNKCGIKMQLIRQGIITK